MSEYESSTDAEIAEELEVLRKRLVIASKPPYADVLHAGDDALMLQAIKRLKIGMCRLAVGVESTNARYIKLADEFIVGIQLFVSESITFHELVKKLNGRLELNQISLALDRLHDLGLIKETFIMNARVSRKIMLTREGISVMQEIFNQSKKESKSGNREEEEEEENRQITAAELEIFKANNDEWEKNQAVLSLVELIVTEEFFKIIEEEIADCDWTSNYRILPISIGSPQEEAWRFVDQRPVGISGDSYAGVESIKIKEGRFFVWDYSI